MPRVMRRTPETEKATAYGYRDLLRDIMERISGGATREVERITGEGLSKEEFLEMALAPAGGMLKIAGTSKLLAGLLARRAEAVKTGMLERSRIVVEPEIAKAFQPAQRVFKEALRVPEKEYGRLKDIRWGIPQGQAFGTTGLYDPYYKNIALSPFFTAKGTIWHEFTHARQYAPDPGREVILAKMLMRARHALKGKHKGSFLEFYHEIDPVERHARQTASAMGSYLRPSFESTYRRLLEENIIKSGRLLSP